MRLRTQDSQQNFLHLFSLSREIQWHSRSTLMALTEEDAETKSMYVDEEEKDAFLGKRDKNEIRIKARNPCNGGMNFGYTDRVVSLFSVWWCSLLC